MTPEPGQTECQGDADDDDVQENAKGKRLLEWHAREREGEHSQRLEYAEIAGREGNADAALDDEDDKEGAEQRGRDG